MSKLPPFDRTFEALTDRRPLSWQVRLFDRLVRGEIPSCCDLPTGLGKTSVMTIWLIARAHNGVLPRRLVYIVDRRVVVDQATEEAEKLRRRLHEKPDLASLALALGLDGEAELRVSTMRGQHVDNRQWLQDPTKPAIIVGTVDMIGSRLLFSGYGVSPRMRPYQAGLLGADALAVLDEAHLCPPFEALLRAIAKPDYPFTDNTNEFGPCAAEAWKFVRPFRLLSLSATGREKEGHAVEVFGLAPEDDKDVTVAKRLAAAKRLSFSVLDEAKKLIPALVERALVLAERPARVLIYCHSRDQAVAVKSVIDTRFKDGEAVAGLLVGARRVHERQKLADWLDKYGFLGGNDRPLDRPMFLVATSAGEVGVDLDADHLVCDLVEWERMVQRLGRVNRRGEKVSRVEVIAAPRERERPDEWAQRLGCLRRPLELLEAAEDGSREASPRALVELKARAAGDAEVRRAIDAATTPEPMRPALTRALVDAWSLTSLEEHTGRPEVQPWLRGWVEEEPQTTLAWRRWLPWREGAASPIADDVKRFFDAAPVHLTERLETEKHRVVDLLTQRAAAAMKRAQDTESRAYEAGLAPNAPALIILGRDGRLRCGFTLKALAELKDDKRRREELFAEMSGALVVVNASLGGLNGDGMLEAGCEHVPGTLDAGWDEQILKEIGYRVLGPGEAEPDRTVWKRAETILLATPEASESGDEQSLHVFVARSEGSGRAGDPAICKHGQPLDEHHEWTAREAERMADALSLPQPYREMLVVAARHHDAGKDRELWQSAMNARWEGRPYAKTEGGGDSRRLGGYRHEFGSVREVETGAALAGLDEDLRDLAYHLIVAHHGHGRPTIEPFDPGHRDAPESREAQEARAVRAGLRFARLQRRYGPWGLAWLEALLRAADWRASARLDAQDASVSQRAEAAD